MRLWLTLGGLLVLAVIGGGAIWWMFLSSFGERQLLASQERLQEQGYTLQYAAAERGGFPLALEWVVHDVTLTHPGDGIGQMSFTGRAERVRFVSAPWSPQEVTFQVEGQHRWEADSGGDAGIVDITVDQTSGTIGPQAETSGWRAETQLAGITASPRQNAAGDLTVRDAVVTAETPLRMDALALDARLEHIALPQDFGLGTVIEVLRLNGDLRPLPADYSPAGLRAWQAAGGRLTVADAQLRFGPLDGGASGALALDEGLRPLGDMTVRVQRPAELLALAQQRGWIDQNQVPLYAMAISLFTRSNGNGEPEAVVQVGFRGGGIWLGPLRLADLPPIAAD